MTRAVRPRMSGANACHTAALRHWIEPACRFIEHEDRRILQQGAGKRKTLPFASAQLRAPFAQRRFQPQRQSVDPTVELGRVNSRAERFFRGIRPGKQQVRADARVEKVRRLRDHADLRSELLGGDVRDVPFVHADLAGLRLPQTQEHVRQRRFTCAARTDDCERFAGGNAKAEVIERGGLFRRIAQRYILE